MGRATSTLGTRVLLSTDGLRASKENERSLAAMRYHSSHDGTDDVAPRGVGRSTPPTVGRAVILHSTAVDAPIAWMARSVLEAIVRSADHATPHEVGGKLLGQK